MASKSTDKPNNFIMPAAYRIEIEGWLDESWSDRLAGMTVKTPQQNKRPLVTVLSGRLTDQAELLGVLNALYNIRATLLSVRRLDAPEPSIPAESFTLL